MNFTNTRVDNVSFSNKQLYVFRDDLIHPILNGNKARKLQHLLQNKTLRNIDTIISYGGNQSNMLYALSYLCFIENKKLIYYTTQIPAHLKANPTGNLKEAISFQATIIEIKKEDFKNKIHDIKNKLAKNEFFINQGGKDRYSKYGMHDLSILIDNFIKKNNMKNIDIFIPSGTGTSAFYLQDYLRDYRVLTTPCVGDEEYLKQQFSELKNINKIKHNKHPVIINTTKKYHFGKCYKEFYELYKKTKILNLNLELLYDMKALISIKENEPIISKNILYIHCGGASANKSMEDRYKYLK